jgi:PAS domain S-box-containing protein
MLSMQNFTRKQNILLASLPAIGLIVIIEVLARFGSNFPYPGAFLAAMVAYAAFSGGAPAGFLSCGLVVAYEVFAFQEPGAIFTYSSGNTMRLITAIVCTPLTVIVVCALRERILTAAFKFARGEARTEAEQVIEQEHHQFMTVMEQLPFGVVMVKDTSCKISFANLEAMRLLGHDVTEFHPYAYHRMFHSSGQPYTPDQWPLIRAIQGEIVDNEEFFYAGPGGHLKPMWGRAAPVHNAKGEIVAASMVFHDVSANRRAELAQLELEAIVGSTEDAILSLSLEGVILTWNAAAQRIFGYTADEVHGMQFHMLVAADRREEIPQMLEHIRRGERIGRFESVARAKDGRVRPASIRLAPVLEATGKARAATVIVHELSGESVAEPQERAAAMLR